jgi:dephospho-CoA kinase
MARVIGLTGGIGTGKSTVAAMLEKLGAAVVDADAIGHRVMAAKETVQALVTEFGKDILDDAGAVDRERLGKIVFGDPVKLKLLNGLMHPLMYAQAEREITDLRAADRVVVLDAPLLFEAGWTALIDEVWVTIAPEYTIIRRVKARTGLKEGAIRARIKSQLGARERLKGANVIISTECTLADLEQRIGTLYRERFGGAGAGGLRPA